VSRAAIGALLVVLVCGCMQSRPVDMATAIQDYLAAKSACIARHPDKLTEQSISIVPESKRHVTAWW
jgi:hypothetical protein